MGLLTDPNTGAGGASKIVNIIIKYHKIFSWLLYVGGVVFLLVLAHPIYNERTYFSENALLPGLVTGGYDQERSAVDYASHLVEENKKYPGHAPFPWLEAQFKQLGLEVYSQQFSLSYPLRNSNFTGTNMYAILRSAKTSSTEALVLSAPHRPPNSPHQTTDAGIALLLSTAKYFRSQIYWAKDIIFLITEHEFLGIQAWLEGYHGVSCGTPGVLHSGDLPARAGSIQAAINLEFSSEFPTHVNFKIEGLNGQLPNLDLINLVNRLVGREGLRGMFHSMEEHPRPDSYKGYMKSLKTLMAMMASQATGVPSGNHGLYHRLSIEAITLEGVTIRNRKRAPGDFHTLGRIIEGTFRSLNNLLERFHQSFFFYLLPSVGRYVSIGLYMPMFGVLAAGLPITAVALWFSLIKTPPDTPPPAPVTPPLLTASLPLCLAAYCLGILALNLPGMAARAGTRVDLLPEESVPLSLASFTLLLILLPFLPIRMTPVDGDTIQCLACLQLSVILAAISLYNISLALFLALSYVPLAILATKLEKWSISRVFTIVYSSLCNPIVLTFIAVIVDTVITFPGISLLDMIIRSAQAWQNGVIFSIVDSYIYGNVVYSILTVWVLPSWLLFHLNVASRRIKSKSVAAPPSLNKLKLN